jgi:hypothetical protein
MSNLPPMKVKILKPCKLCNLSPSETKVIIESDGKFYCTNCIETILESVDTLPDAFENLIMHIIE